MRNVLESTQAQNCLHVKGARLMPSILLLLPFLISTIGVGGFESQTLWLLTHLYANWAMLDLAVFSFVFCYIKNII